jgi:transcriptional regulator with XRE-family HTH domain
MATNHQRTVFRRRFLQARTDAGLSQRDVAKAVGVSPSSVAGWENGESAPREATAARLEQVLNLEEGTLGRLLGFLPTSVKSDAIANVSELIDTDPRLGPRERRLLRSMYTELVRQRQEATDEQDPQRNGSWPR